MASIVNIKTLSIYVRNEFLFAHTKGHGEVTPADIHAVTSMTGRTLLFDAFLENGARWSRLPIHALCWKPDAPARSLSELVYWDCFSYDIECIELERCRGLSVDVLNRENTFEQGNYVMTFDWMHKDRTILDTNFSEHPEHKNAHLVALVDGNYGLYPNNKMIWYDGAFVTNPLKENPGYQIDHKIYEVESYRTPQTDNDDWFYFQQKVNLENQTKDLLQNSVDSGKSRFSTTYDPFGNILKDINHG